MWTVVVHGGAGLLDRASLLYPEADYRAALARAAHAAASVLKEGGRAADACVAAVVVLEDSPMFNAGHGAVLTSAGTVECEASVMDGTSRACGCAIGLTCVKNPVLAAQAVMKASPHCVLAGPAAESLARNQGLQLCEQSYYITEPRVAQLSRVQSNTATATSGTASTVVDLDHGGALGTVGAVCRDTAGGVAAASSTGGVCNKWPGRVGDTPLPGCGLVATPDVAVACTGRGEAFVRHTSAAMVAAAAATQGLGGAVAGVLGQMQPGDGGMIAVDAAGTWTAQFTTGGMLRAACSASAPEPQVDIW